MRESVLQNLWKSQAFPLNPLVTTSGESLQVLAAGKLNRVSGPDFHFSKIRIGDQIWSGHVEVHIRASDWYSHGHHRDDAYNSVILHVVWLADTGVRRKDGTTIPTLELSALMTGRDLPPFPPVRHPGASKALLCQSMLPLVPAKLRDSWLQELYTCRLGEKSREVLLWADESSQDWDQVFFKALLKGFGLNLNGQAFLSLASALPFPVIRKIRSDLTALESLFFGLSGLLARARFTDRYTDHLMGEYNYLKAKFGLSSIACQKPEYFSLRPGNFPTIRLSQLAVLYHSNPSLYDRVRMSTTLKEAKSSLHTRASTYWDTHHTFGKSCGKRTRKTTGRFTELLILNAVMPVLLAHAQSIGRPPGATVTEWAKEIKPENNRLIRLFRREGVSARNALESQALIQLYNNFCQKNKCLQCRWGTYLLYGKY